MPEPDVYLGVGSGTHAQQTARVMVAIEDVCIQHKPALVVVAGDVNSTVASALAASKLGSGIVNPYPEAIFNPLQIRDRILRGLRCHDFRQCAVTLP